MQRCDSENSIMFGACWGKLEFCLGLWDLAVAAKRVISAQPLTRMLVGAYFYETLHLGTVKGRLLA